MIHGTGSQLHKFWWIRRAAGCFGFDKERTTIKTRMAWDRRSLRKLDIGFDSCQGGPSDLVGERGPRLDELVQPHRHVLRAPRGVSGSRWSPAYSQPETPLVSVNAFIVRICDFGIADAIPAVSTERPLGLIRPCRQRRALLIFSRFKTTSFGCFLETVPLQYAGFPKQFDDNQVRQTAARVGSYLDRDAGFSAGQRPDSHSGEPSCVRMCRI